MRALAFGLAVVVVACGGSVVDGKIEGAPATGWEVVDPLVPKQIEPPIVEGGVLLNSYRDGERVTVTFVYGPADRERLAAVYEEWSAERGGVKSGRGFDVPGGVAWQDSWAAGISEVRVSECLNRMSGEFDNLCVALTTRVGSVP